MSLLDDLLIHFEVLNAKADLVIVEKCVKLCETYNLTADDFIDEWLAYSASKSLGLAPTLDALDKLERYELKKAKSVTTTPQLNVKVESLPTPTRTPIRKNLQAELIESQIEDYVSHSVPSEEFHKRTGAGSVLQEVGKFTNSNNCNRSLVLKLANTGMERCRYMYEKFLVKRATLNSISKWIVNDIRNYYKLELTSETLKQYSGEMTICGRFFSNTYGKFDKNTIYLEGIIELYRGYRIRISTKNVQKARLFNGQSVVLTGNNMKDWFTVKDIYIGAPLPEPNIPDLKETIQIMVASGPYTLLDNLLYEPLEQFLNAVLQVKPNILILMGPFLEEAHPHLENFEERYDLFFEKIIGGIMQKLETLQTQVILVPSPKDVTSSVSFPTYPYKMRRRYNNLRLASNPFFLDVEGLIISGTTTDVIFHLGQIEFSKGKFSDRIEQLIKHLFYQRSFYPMHPPDPELNVDYRLLEEFGMFEKAPHVMILPSNLKHYVKIVENSMVINPERLTKGREAGTYATLEVRATTNNNICDNISCKIQRI